MAHVDPDAPQPAQPEPPAAAWAPPQGEPVPGPAPAASRRRIPGKWLRVGAVAVIAIGLGVARLTGNFGIGEPEVGDCVKAKGATSFEVVDCTSSDAAAKIVGIAAAKLTSKEFDESQSACAEFPQADVELWTGDATEKGTVYCARSLRAGSSNGSSNGSNS